MTKLLSLSLFDYAGANDSLTPITNDEATTLDIDNSAIVSATSDGCFSDSDVMQMAENVEPIDVFESAVFEDMADNSLNELNHCDSDIHTSHDSCSGFMISDEGNFVTFDSESGACDWGCDMSMNADF